MFHLITFNTLFHYLCHPRILSSLSLFLTIHSFLRATDWQRCTAPICSFLDPVLVLPCIFPNCLLFCPEDRSSKFFRNISTFIPNRTPMGQNSLKGPKVCHHLRKRSVISPYPGNAYSLQSKIFQSRPFLTFSPYFFTIFWPLQNNDPWQMPQCRILCASSCAVRIYVCDNCTGPYSRSCVTSHDNYRN
jgi:hypothetical protein